MKTQKPKELSEEEEELVKKLREHPEMRAQIMGMLEDLGEEQGRGFDEVEEKMVRRVREIGRLGLQEWAQKKADEAGLRAPEAGARRGAKKK